MSLCGLCPKTMEGTELYLKKKREITCKYKECTAGGMHCHFKRKIYWDTFLMF